jgi:EipB-like
LLPSLLAGFRVVCRQPAISPKIPGAATGNLPGRKAALISAQGAASGFRFLLGPSPLPGVRSLCEKYHSICAATCPIFGSLHRTKVLPSMKNHIVLEGLAAAVVVGAVLAAPAVAHAAKFQPHRAVYDLSLKSAESRSGIAALSGKMVFEVQGSKCEGYAIEFRLITETTGSNGAVRLTDVRTSSFEAGDGDGFQFLTQTYLDQQLTQESRGAATRTDEELEVELKKPAEKTVTFDENVLFPSQHFLEIIRRAEAGETFFNVDIYDGSEEGDTFYETATVIGKPRDIVVQEGDAKGRTEKHWPVVISYYDPTKNQTDSTPIYTLSFLTNGPGVSRDLKMDYEAFSIAGKLSELEFLQTPDCDGPPQREAPPASPSPGGPVQ